ncbi:hypothetical protein PC118_g4254 [Phytophthora cactorum]|uniref:Uncharacterized protein n=1 Tax=Phytophthora cactorum TaxID=29920 RepID=A0A8T1GK23_9STRA|nr:hypothetical protein PC118_g4254 [Phytophthora cactorum]
MMSVIYVKGRRDSYDEPTTPQDCPDGDLLTPNGSNGYTPREGSLVLVETPIGCVALTNCRLCRATKNKDNQFLINCAVIQETNPGSARRLCTADNAEDPMPRNFTTIALSCVGGMALVVAIIGLAHSKFCRRDNTVLLMRLA